ncbi:hypothetical protein [Streptomyces carpinensis]|uniref:Uncharacterized protein n=1 Tax=Streptomyces carpinensis TaxID=66369 RepID=A0ABV1WH33_9ACTN|nr:hypothetical protein [Streptomyces carpinensis]
MRSARRTGHVGLLLDLGLPSGVFYGAQALGVARTPSLLAATAAAGARLAWARPAAGGSTV